MISISSRMLLYLSLFMRSPYLTVIYTEKTWSNVTWHLNNFSDHTFKATERCFLRQPDQYGKEGEEMKPPIFYFDQLTLGKELTLRLATALAKIRDNLGDNLAFVLIMAIALQNSADRSEA